jgi:hypothetical protein
MRPAEVSAENDCILLHPKHNVLYQSDGVQHPPSLETDSTKAQHRLNRIG